MRFVTPRVPTIPQRHSLTYALSRPVPPPAQSTRTKKQRTASYGSYESEEPQPEHLFSDGRDGASPPDMVPYSGSAAGGCGGVGGAHSGNSAMHVVLRAELRRSRNRESAAASRDRARAHTLLLEARVEALDERAAALEAMVRGSGDAQLIDAVDALPALPVLEDFLSERASARSSRQNSYSGGALCSGGGSGGGGARVSTYGSAGGAAARVSSYGSAVSRDGGAGRTGVRSATAAALTEGMARLAAARKGASSGSGAGGGASVLTLSAASAERAAAVAAAAAVCSLDIALGELGGGEEGEDGEGGDVDDDSSLRSTWQEQQQQHRSEIYSSEKRDGAGAGAGADGETAARRTTFSTPGGFLAMKEDVASESDAAHGPAASSSAVTSGNDAFDAASLLLSGFVRAKTPVTLPA